VVMPVTSAGFFAVDIVGGTRAAILGHLTAAFVYSCVLAVFSRYRDAFGFFGRSAEMMM
jgi:hypothetical protein